MNRKIKSTIFLFTAAIVWGFAFVFQKMGGDDVPTFWFNGIRFIIGAISLVPVVLLFEREKKDTKRLLRTMRAAAICAGFLFVASYLQQTGIVMTGDSGKSGFITALYSVIVPIAYFIFFRKKTSFNVWLGALLAIGGIFLLSVKGNFTVEVGDIFLLVGAVFWAGHIISIDLLVRDVSPIKFALFQALFCGIYNLCVAVPVETVTLAGVQSALIPLLYCGVCSTAIAYTCQILGQKFSDDQTLATIILSTESLFSAVGGALIGNEVMTAKGYFGCVLIFVGVIVAQLELKKRKA
ncbi:MAG: DMT family transporter [Clostridia bacterium]|nr:DMT family transporter [Clostridia bacterium]